MDVMDVYVIVIILACVAIIGSMIASNKKLKQLKRYWEIQRGMTEAEMLEIMGKGYNRSLLKNNRVKYEWRINATSHGTSYKGTSTRTYTGVKKVDIYVKDGLVEEVKSHNV